MSDATVQKATTGACAAFAALVVVALSDGCTVRDVCAEPATVVRTTHHPAGSPLSAGAVALVSAHERWEVVVRTAAGAVVSSETDRGTWAGLKEGDRVTLVHRAGWTGWFVTTAVRR